MADMTLPNSPEMHRMSKQYYDGPKSAKDLLNTTYESKQTATPMIDRAMTRMGVDSENALFQKVEQQPTFLLTTIERALKDIYEWACEKQRDNQGLLYDLNTAISAVERCGVKIKDGRS